MSQSASQAAAFRHDVAKRREVWLVEDDGGIPAPTTSGGRRAMPFFSTRSRAEKTVAAGVALRGCRPRSISLDEFLTKWLPRLQEDELLVGVNWTGPSAVGYDIEPDVIASWFVA